MKRGVTPSILTSYQLNHHQSLTVQPHRGEQFDYDAPMRLVACLASLLPLLALAQTCPTRASWPTQEWPIELVDSTKKATELKALEDYLFTLTGADEERLGLRTEGLVIIKHGKLVYERYAKGFDETKRHLSWSVGKSISSALVGIAKGEGLLSLDDSICTHLPEYAGRPQCAITVRDAISFTTGLDWQETYEGDSYQLSSVIAMLFGVGHRDVVRFLLDHQVAHTPGTYWNYSTGDANLAATLAKRALSKKYGDTPFWPALFDRIGMSRTVFEEDAAGSPMGGSMVYATPRDYAKFGWLFLNDGCWNGERILPSNWVKDSTTPSPAFVTSDDKGEPNGFSWWLNVPITERQLPSPWKNSPVDSYAAIGHWGQFIMVVPSEDLVVVRTGDDRDDDVDEDKLISLSIAVAK